ncbi:MAG: DUF1045 domain-containing protein [Candidatus Diapherotrites archaeon]|nr:DUF1045 domain-containing protein [Candidatus Diapherotrites archaeon]
MGIYSLVLVPNAGDIRLFEKLMESASAISGAKKKGIPPHISLRETFETRDIDGLMNEISGFVNKFFPIKISFDGYKILHREYAVLEAVKTRKLQELHKKTVKAVDKYRTNYVLEKYKKGKASLTKKQKAYLNLHGYPYCLYFYLPHMTLVYGINPKKLAKAKAFLGKQKIPKSIRIGAITLLKKSNARKMEWAKKLIISK